MNKYYIVTAKCGHVGKGKYIDFDFPIKAIDKSSAAQIVLKKAKVKKHLKNAITSVIEVSYSDYFDSMLKYKKDMYIHSHYKNEVSLDTYNIKSIDRNEEKFSSFESREERIKYYLKKMKLKSEDYYYAYY